MALAFQPDVVSLELPFLLACKDLVLDGYQVSGLRTGNNNVNSALLRTLFSLDVPRHFEHLAAERRQILLLMAIVQECLEKERTLSVSTLRTQ